MVPRAGAAAAAVAAGGTADEDDEVAEAAAAAAAPALKRARHGHQTAAAVEDIDDSPAPTARGSVARGVAVISETQGMLDELLVVEEEDEEDALAFPAAATATATSKAGAAVMLRPATAPSAASTSHAAPADPASDVTLLPVTGPQRPLPPGWSLNLLTKPTAKLTAAQAKAQQDGSWWVMEEIARNVGHGCTPALACFGLLTLSGRVPDAERYLTLMLRLSKGAQALTKNEKEELQLLGIVFAMSWNFIIVHTSLDSWCFICISHFTADGASRGRAMEGGRR